MTWVHQPLAYQDGAHGACDEKVLAANTIAKQFSIFGTTVHVNGHCPFCFGPISFSRKLKLIAASADGTTGQSASESGLDVTVKCTCPLDHSERPAGAVGCGRLWVATGV